MSNQMDNCWAKMVTQQNATTDQIHNVSPSIEERIEAANLDMTSE